MKKLHFFWKELMATFWFVPVLIICFAVLLSIGMVSMDRSVTISQEGWVRYFLVNSSDSARSILSTISGAMIGVAGTVFSVTLVALTLASTQFGPRLVKNFMYIRLNQIVLGSYISTYLYCLIVLNSIKDSGNDVFVPSISIGVALLAAIANIILLIIFIHRIAVSIQADKVISEISDIISKQIENLFPERMGDENGEIEKYDESMEMLSYQKNTTIKSVKSGYLQYVDGGALMQIVAKNESLFNLYHRPGSFLVEGGEIGVLYSNKGWEAESLDNLLTQFVIGKTKTSQQDLEFSIHQMVEIAARALSPGVNDPYTAIACIDNLTATMCYLAEAHFPSKYRKDEEGKLRVIADVLNFEGLLDAAFNQIRQFSVGSPSVIIRLMEALTTILYIAKRESHKIAVVKHAEMVYRLGKRTIKEENDMNDLEERAGRIIET